MLTHLLLPILTEIKKLPDFRISGMKVKLSKASPLQGDLHFKINYNPRILQIFAEKNYNS